MDSPDLTEPSNYINRELSWLSFNERVLCLAERSDVPLLERLKFIAIAASNLDEFYMVRIGSLERQQARAAISFEPGPDGLALKDILDRAHLKAHELASRMGRILNADLLPKLAQHGIVFHSLTEIDESLRKNVGEYYEKNVHPTLTPIAIDSAHPFPMLRSGTLNIALRIAPNPNGRIIGAPESRDGPLSALVQVPSVLPRFVAFHTEETPHLYVALEDIIQLHVSQLFPGYQILETTSFRITRASDLDIVEDEAEDLLLTIEDELRRRDRGEPVRLQLSPQTSPALRDMLVNNLNLSERHIFEKNRFIANASLMKVYGEVQAPELRDPSFNPAPAPRLRYARSVFRAIAEKDLLLHHPYESFRHVVDFIQQSADDENVVAIKQTLYRTSGNSPIVRALAKAAERGKDVTALVELKARFDEANNIAWARHLEESGVHVVYGLLGLKTHSKILLVTRREGDTLRRYLHLGTGNYHPSTARLYTDLGLFTARPDITHDAMLLFNVLTGYAELPQMNQLVVAPFNLRNHILERIDTEIEHARAGNTSGILAKMNSLVDGEIIEALYRASQAGVPIDLIIRGICCLRPGIPGISENIRVRSILDRFLEHSRVFWWKNGGDDQLYLSSADWMPRNLNRRIECCFPVLDPDLKSRIIEEIFPIELADNTHSWELNTDGVYQVIAPEEGEPANRAQLKLMLLARARSDYRPLVRAELSSAGKPLSPAMRLIEAQRRRESNIHFHPNSGSSADI
ncbi:MAG: polyphosphate kinase 1 [Myxococcales bacterium]|nr:polyphosphate kinase 1 [Myxococcales bacterium]